MARAAEPLQVKDAHLLRFKKESTSLFIMWKQNKRHEKKQKQNQSASKGEMKNTKLIKASTAQRPDRPK